MTDEASVLDQAMTAGASVEKNKPAAFDRALLRHAEVDALSCDTILLLANGKSRVAYEAELAHAARARRDGHKPPPIADQVWCIGNAADRYRCDRAFDLKADLTAHSYKHRPTDFVGSPAPIFVSRITPDMEAENDRPDGRIFVEFPAAAVAGRFRSHYANSTAAWALPAAVYAGAKTIKLFGFDFDEPHVRACCEFWIGAFSYAGIVFVTPMNSTLLDSHMGQRAFGFPDLDIQSKGPRFTA
jgi:hypothetical protein